MFLFKFTIYRRKIISVIMPAINKAILNGSVKFLYIKLISPPVSYTIMVTDILSFSRLTFSLSFAASLDFIT